MGRGRADRGRKQNPSALRFSWSFQNSERLYPTWSCPPYLEEKTPEAKCEDMLFGQLLQDMFDNEARDTMIRRVYDKTAKFFSQLPEEFTTQDVMRVFGYTSNSTASRKIGTFVDQKIVEKCTHGRYRKLAKAI